MKIKQIHEALLQGKAVTLKITILRGYLTGSRTLRLHPKRYTPTEHRSLEECRLDLQRDLRNFKYDEKPYEQPVYSVLNVTDAFKEQP